MCLNVFLAYRLSLTLIVSMIKVNGGKKILKRKIFLLYVESCLWFFCCSDWQLGELGGESENKVYNLSWICYWSTLLYETAMILWYIRSVWSAAAYNQ